MVSLKFQKLSQGGGLDEEEAAALRLPPRRPLDHFRHRAIKIFECNAGVGTAYSGVPRPPRPWRRGQVHHGEQGLGVEDALH